MKKYLLILAMNASLAILLFACQKKETLADAPTGVESNVSITGKWNIVSMTSTQNAGKGATEFSSSYTGMAGDYFEFKKDGTVDARQNNHSANMNYTLADNKITLALGELYSDVLTVETLNAHKLVLQLNKVSEDGQTFSKTYTFAR